MQELKEKFAEWMNFTTIREAERVKASAPPEPTSLSQQVKDKKAELLRVKAELQMLQAQVVLSNDGKARYSRAAFDHEWSQKKAALKAEVEALMAEQMEAGVSIPKLMKELQSRNPVWLYQVKENLSLYRGASKEDMAQTTWEWSDATSVHRYGLAKAPDTNEWAFVLMHGAVDSEFEHEKCMFDFKTGHYITGNRDLFDSVAVGARKQRALILSEILDGTYLKKIRRDHNPYFNVK